MEMRERLSISESWGRLCDGFRSDGKHDGFTEVESKVNLNSKVSAKMECRRQREERGG